MDREKENSGVEDADNGEDIEDFEDFDLVEYKRHDCDEQCEEKQEIKGEDYPHNSWD